MRLLALQSTRGLEALAVGTRVASGLFQQELFLDEEPEGSHFLGAVAGIQPYVQLLAALRRQVCAGKQRLSLAEKAYRVGIVIPQIFEPTFESPRRAGVDAVVDARGDPEVGVWVRLVEEYHDCRGVYRGELYVFPEPLLYLLCSLPLGG